MTSRTVSAVMLPQGSHTEPEPMLYTDGDIDAIQRVVGGVFDAVRVRVSYGPDQECVLVGYVNDEGLFDPNCEMNYLATALFQRELRGNVLVVSGTNPENGMYDGDSYDVPEWAWEGIRTDVLHETADAYNDAVLVNFALRFGPEVGLMERDEAEAFRKRIVSIAEALQNGEEVHPLSEAEEEKLEYFVAWAKFTILAVKQNPQMRDFVEGNESVHKKVKNELFDKMFGDFFKEEE